MARFHLAPSLELAREFIDNNYVCLTVEAEYGAAVVEGERYTAAHHGPAGTKWAGRHIGGTRHSPCCDEEVPWLDAGEYALVSHVDLDTFGGCLRAVPEFQDLFAIERSAFWALAEWVDVRGPHRLAQSAAFEDDLRRLRAFWAWSKAEVPRHPRDAVTEVTAVVQQAGEALRRILADDTELLAAGEALRMAEAELNRRTFLGRRGPVVVRESQAARDFCNHLYAAPNDGEVALAVCAYCEETGAVTISLCEPVPGISCRELVQELWGPEAGGHDGIAGSPRGLDVGAEGLERAVRLVLDRLGWGPPTSPEVW